MSARFFLVLILALLLSDAHSQTATLEQQLRDHYQGKTFLLRGFLNGEHLHYLPSGAPIVSKTTGDWTVDGFVKVNKVQIRQQSLILKARRLVAVYVDRKFKLLPAATEESVEMTVDLGADAAPMENIEAVTSRVFLGEQDSLADLVPDYWKSCVRSGPIEKTESCQFSTDILSVPGVIPSGGIRSSPPVNQRSLVPAQLFRVGNGIRPPKEIYYREADFSEAAQGLKLQGTVVLGLTVSVEGKPTNVRILSPLGAGLDANAVRAVEGWKFKPAESDGKPVAVEIAVEVQFP